MCNSTNYTMITGEFIIGAKPTLVENLACLLAYARLFLLWGPLGPTWGEIALTN